MRFNEERRPPPQPKITYSGKERFGTAHQNNKEMLQTYRSYLKSLYDRAYPRYAMGPIPIDSCTRQPDAVRTAHREQSKAILINNFIKTSHQKEVRVHILKMKPATTKTRSPRRWKGLPSSLEKTSPPQEVAIWSKWRSGQMMLKTATCHYRKTIGHFANNCYKKAGNLKKTNLALKGALPGRKPSRGCTQTRPGQQGHQQNSMERNQGKASRPSSASSKGWLKPSLMMRKKRHLHPKEETK